jgi:MFS family permease
MFGLWQLLAGPLSDRYGRYPVIVTGVLGVSALAASFACWRRRSAG